MNTRFLKLAAIFGALAVIAGAMFTHSLKNNIPLRAAEIYETAVRYQFYHVFALLATGILGEKFQGPWLNRAGYCFIAGILLFSGSLFFISALITKGISVPLILGILTPTGGLGFILGWVFLSIAVWKGRPS